MPDQVNLKVNGQPIDMIPFVEDFVAQVADGIVQSLRGAAPMDKLELLVTADAVTVQQNGGALEVNEFVSKIIRSTVLGMVTPLKGVSDPKEVLIEIVRN
jgi:hypothetical protein